MPISKRMRSYISFPMGIAGRISEAFYLYHWHSRGVRDRIHIIIDRMHSVENIVEEKTGLLLHNLRMLEIGPGQQPMRALYFSRYNDVTAIDLDPILLRFRPFSYVKMLWTNGFIRTLKTIIRKLLAFDRKFFSELELQLGVSLKKHQIKILRGDAAKMPLEDESFDFVYSFSVLEHIPDPGRVIDEALRIVKPGGVIYFCVHLYTSENGCHDPRIFCGRRSKIPLWAHLRPQYCSGVRANVYLNKLRLNEWKHLFSSRLPGVHFEYLRYGEDRLKPELNKLYKAGELRDFTPEELLTVNLVALWQKPNS